MKKFGIKPKNVRNLPAGAVKSHVRDGNLKIQMHLVSESVYLQKPIQIFWIEDLLGFFFSSFAKHATSVVLK